MNAAHVHLILNHIPIIGTMMAIFVLIAGFLMKSDDVKRVCLMVLVLTALITIPVYLSGKDSEGMIEGNYEDVDEEFIEEHEDFALYSFIAMDVAGFIGLVGLILFRRPKDFPLYFTIFMFLILSVVNGMMGWTANLGGKIHHPEIREDTFPWEEKIPKEETETDTEKEDVKEEDKEAAEEEEHEETENEKKDKGTNRGKGGDKK
jgi:hypothetical protein